jgi:hypothetical protein|tara:strand:+ start:102 stop:335 length:234 start_codon:yes stop_codon:yes gene_type:complete
MNTDRTYYIAYDNETRFWIQETRFGLYQTGLEDGTKLLTGLDKDGTLKMTAQHIVWMKEGFPEPLSGSYDGVVGGKL